MVGFVDVRRHTLRHTRASLMIQGGAHMKVISEILDMSLETYDKIYAHLSKKEINEMADWMGRESDNAFAECAHNIRQKTKKSRKIQTIGDNSNVN